MKRTLVTVVASGFGAGYLPVASGTWASALAAALYWYLFPSGDLVTMLAAVSAAVVGIPAATAAEKIYGKKDDSRIVIDEIAGMWISLLFLPHTLKVLAAAFVVFRVLDVIKPFGIRRIQSLRGGWGVMADDVLAAVATNIILHLSRYLTTLT
ncbi:MAG: phosphatidylglycerophosphatase A family protein [Endomicrobiales bacterium]